MTVRVLYADCREAMRELAAEGFRASCVVTDPPYEIGFMGRAWDRTGVAFDPETWRAAFDLLPPGGHLAAFAGARTYHRIACAVEDAGFEVRDQLLWLYGQGFPKSHHVGKALDKAAGAKRSRVPKANASPVVGVAYAQDAWTRAHAGTKLADGAVTDEAAAWEGWGTALKPAHEPIVLARKPLAGTVAANVLAHGAGALHVDACRVPIEAGVEGRRTKGNGAVGSGGTYEGGYSGAYLGPSIPHPDSARHDARGRWPANVLHDGSPEVMEAFAEFGERGGFAPPSGLGASTKHAYGSYGRRSGVFHGDSGSAARFFFCAKASAAERAGSKHPTVKPLALMRWLVRLLTPPGGVVLDPFAGTGATLEAALAEGFGAVGVELREECRADIERRIVRARATGHQPALPLAECGRAGAEARPYTVEDGR